MQWVIQQNLINRDDYQRFITELDANGATWFPIDVIPFSDELVLPDGIVNPVVFMGSTSLQRMVLSRPEFVPGVWTNSNFSFEVQRQHWGDCMLNADATVFPFNEIPAFNGVRFIRPVHDTKSFTGMVLSGTEFTDWQKKIIGSHTQMHDEVPSVVSTWKDIQSEWRFFVIDGVVVTGSHYKGKYRMIVSRIDLDYEVDREAFEYAQRCVDVWAPADVFVLDVARIVTERNTTEYRIIEVNSFNCSGMYDSDVGSIIRAVDKFVGVSS